MKILASDVHEEALRRLVRKWLKEVRSLARDAGRGDVDAVHDIRTGLRRLRTLLGLAAGRRAERLRKGAKGLGVQLGIVRDLDVALVRVAECVRRGELFLDEGVRAWNAAMTHERQEALRALKRTLRAKSTRNWFRKARAWTVRSSHGPRVHEAMPQALDGLVREVVSRSGSADPAERHELRKSLKRLRYAVELFDDALPWSAEEIADAAHAAQDSLGEQRDRLTLAERAEREASACSVMGEDPRELLTFARRLREEIPGDAAVTCAVARAKELIAGGAGIQLL